MHFEQEKDSDLKRNPTFCTSSSNKFQNLIELAAYICEADFSMINLMYAGQLSTKASFGLENERIPKTDAISKYALEQEEDLFLIEDLSSDSRFKELPMVKEGPEFRFYAGCTLKSSDGNNIGTICVLDSVPRSLSSKHTNALKSLASEVEEKVENWKLYDRLREMMTFLKNSSDLIFSVDIETKLITDIQGNVEELTGSQKVDLIGNDVSTFISDQIFINAFDELADQEINSRKSLETFLLQRMCFLDLRMLRGESEVLVAARNITSKKMAERGHKKSLREKQVLLEEIHHRVKNNLALISSLLLIEEFNSTNKQVQGILEKSQNRIKSMSLIHEVLYQANSYVRVPLKRFLEEYIKSITPRLKTNGKDITLKSKIFVDGLNLNQAVPCALIINELVTNAYEHAFEDQNEGSVEVSLLIKDETFYLTVEDSGVGLSEDWDIDNFESVGYTLVKTLVSQLGGEITHKNTPGAWFQVSFKKDYNKGSQSSMSGQEFDRMID